MFVIKKRKRKHEKIKTKTKIFTSFCFILCRARDSGVVLSRASALVLLYPLRSVRVATEIQDTPPPLHDRSPRAHRPPHTIWLVV
jgi:hypothetical protein